MNEMRTLAPRALHQCCPTTVGSGVADRSAVMLFAQESLAKAEKDAE